MIEIIIISGPIASGKSTVGRMLYERLAPDSSFVDIDDLINAIDPQDSDENDIDRQPAWYLAKKQISEICKDASNNKKNFFVIAAPFFTTEDIESFTDVLDIECIVKHFFLNVSLSTRVARMEKREHKNSLEEMATQVNKIELTLQDANCINIDAEKPLDRIVNNILSLI